MLDLLALLMEPFIAVGAVLGTLLGLGAAVLLHYLVPGQDLSTPQALLVALGIVVGVGAGMLVRANAERK